MLAALRRLSISLDTRSAPREEIGQPVGLEPVAEAVSNCYLGDLRQAAEVPGGRLSHPVSVTSRSGYTLDRTPAHGPGGVKSDSTRR